MRLPRVDWNPGFAPGRESYEWFGAVSSRLQAPLDENEHERRHTGPASPASCPTEWPRRDEIPPAPPGSPPEPRAVRIH